MALPRIPLATVDELRLIAVTAQQGIYDHFYDDDDDDNEADDYFDLEPEERQRRDERFHAAIAAARFCASVAVHLDAHDLCPHIVDFLVTLPHLEGLHDDDVRGLAGAVSTLLQRGAPICEDVAQLARHDDVRVRHHMAKGIRPNDDFEIELLMKLAGDPVADVRTAARASLSARKALPWWHGKLGRDPMEGLSPEEQSTHKAAIERVVEIIDMPRLHEEAYAELAKLAEALPDAIAVDIAESVLRSTEHIGPDDVALPTVMLSRRGGMDALLRTLGRWANDTWAALHGVKVFVEAIVALPIPERRAIVAGLVKFALGATIEQRTAYLGAAEHASEIASQAWIPGDDTEPVLDALLALEAPPEDDDGDHDRVADNLAHVLEHPPASPERMFERALAARLAGYPDALGRVKSALGALLGAAPRAMIRDAAFPALTHEHDGTSCWALVQILGDAHDPALDPPLEEQIEAMLAVPRYRGFICSIDDLCSKAIAPLRLLLREGRLPIDQAQAVISQIGSLWGGLATSAFFEVEHRKASDSGAHREQARAEQREKYAAFLGPPELHGPPTEDEWRALREARLRHPDPEIHDMIDDFPEGPTWHPDDLAAIERAMGKAQHDDETNDMLHLAVALTSKANPESLRLLDQLAARFPRSRDLRRARRILAKRLGAAPAEPNDPEWMDEPEDGSDG